MNPTKSKNDKFDEKVRNYLKQKEKEGVIPSSSIKERQEFLNRVSKMDFTEIQKFYDNE